MARLYNSHEQATDDDATTADDNKQKNSGEPINGRRLIRVQAKNPRTFMDWAMEALKNTPKGIEPEDMEPPRHRIYVVAPGDFYNFCLQCGKSMSNATARRNNARRTTLITCPHCGQVLEYVLKR